MSQNIEKIPSNNFISSDTEEIQVPRYLVYTWVFKCVLFVSYLMQYEVKDIKNNDGDLLLAWNIGKYFNCCLMQIEREWWLVYNIHFFGCIKERACINDWMKS